VCCCVVSVVVWLVFGLVCVVLGFGGRVWLFGFLLWLGSVVCAGVFLWGGASGLLAGGRLVVGVLYVLVGWGVVLCVWVGWVLGCVWCGVGFGGFVVLGGFWWWVVGVVCVGWVWVVF
ncbi:hypothetical protein RA268_27950, partial [Pseudomonas syringae pv. tagetis]